MPRMYFLQKIRVLGFSDLYRCVYKLIKGISMKKTFMVLVFLFTSLNVLAIDVNGKLEVLSSEVRDSDGVLIDSDYLYYGSYIIKDSILFGVNIMGDELEIGKLECNESLCTGGPFYNDADLPETLIVNIPLDENKVGLIEVDWDENHKSKVKFIRN